MRDTDWRQLTNHISQIGNQLALKPLVPEEFLEWEMVEGEELEKLILFWIYLYFERQCLQPVNGDYNTEFQINNNGKQSLNV